MCEKQCRDANGFKCHCLTESHQRQMRLFSENSSTLIRDFSNDFTQGFMNTLKVRWGSKKVLANKVYQDYIADKEHVHMNATRWNSVHGFVLFCKAKGLIELEETEKGPVIQYIDKSYLLKTTNSMSWQEMDLQDEARLQLALDKQRKLASQTQNEHDEVATPMRPLEGPIGQKTLTKSTAFLKGKPTGLLKKTNLVFNDPE